MNRTGSLLLILTLGAAGCAPARQPQPPPLKDLTYAAPNGNPQKLDLYLPTATDGKPAPVIIWIHGGAWEKGSKGHGGRVKEMVNDGFAVADINYRLSGEAPFPAQIIDCKSAVRWLRANAGKYQLDPNRIGVAGNSAGGHLASLLGTTGTIRTFDQGDHMDQSSAVQAVCNLSGPTSILALKDQASPEDIATMAKLLGGPPDQEPYASLAASVDPIGYINGSEPPFLIIHGSHDRTVPCSQSTLLNEALKKSGGKPKLFIVSGADHNLKGGKNAGESYINTMIAKFFSKTL